MPTGAEAAHRCDRAAVRRTFERAATTYDAAAIVQAEAREELLRRLDYVTVEPRLVVDAGAGTGQASRALARRYPRARVVALDLAFAMLRASGRRAWWRRAARFDRLCGDLERLPFADASVDLLFSNLALPWCDPDRALAEARRVLAPHGLLSLTTLGPDTLRELRAAWTQVDAGAHVIPFVDMHDLGDALVRAGFVQPVLDVEHRTLQYADFAHLVADLRASGSRNVLAARARGLTGRRKAHAMRAAYERERRDGRLPASCEIVFAHAWAAVTPPPAPARDDPAVIPLETLRDSLRDRRRR
jgi:malonyl-CoA O-methyltransferase